MLPSGASYLERRDALSISDLGRDYKRRKAARGGPEAAIGIKSKRRKHMQKIDEQVDREKQQRPEFKVLQRRIIAEIVDIGIGPETAERLARDHGFPFGDLRNDLKQIDTEVKRYITDAKKVGLSVEEACKLTTTKWDEVS